MIGMVGREVALHGIISLHQQMRSPIVHGRIVKIRDFSMTEPLGLADTR